jgi:hypothetical protein
MVSSITYDHILRVIQQFEILRRDAKDFAECIRLRELIADMKRKLAETMKYK